MAALTRGKKIIRVGDTNPSGVGPFIVKSSSTIYRGALCLVDASGFAIPAAAAAANSNRLAVGVWEGENENGVVTGDQSVVGDGTKKVVLRKGSYVFAAGTAINDSAVNLSNVWAATDNGDISETNGGNYPLAGKFLGTNADGTVSIRVGE